MLKLIDYLSHVFQNKICAYLKIIEINHMKYYLSILSSLALEVVLVFFLAFFAGFKFF